MEEANFVPIATQHLPDGMSVWERYMHRDEPDRLVQLAILHAEFEALHPFLDGNGRMGRMLVPLFMWQRELIRQPAFYVSAYFEANREAYYEGLRSVSRDDDWSGWCAFFLEAVRTQAEDNLVKTEAILGLYEEMKDRVLEVTTHGMRFESSTRSSSVRSLRPSSSWKEPTRRRPLHAGSFAACASREYCGRSILLGVAGLLCSYSADCSTSRRARRTDDDHQ